MECSVLVPRPAPGVSSPKAQGVCLGLHQDQSLIPCEGQDVAGVDHVLPGGSQRAPNTVWSHQERVRWGLMCICLFCAYLQKPRAVSLTAAML